VIIERTPGEKKAFLAGYKAAIEMFNERFIVHNGGKDPLVEATMSEVQSIADLIEETIAKVQS
jgi:hypothetical protein